jgi:hypothetical protein
LAQNRRIKRLNEAVLTISTEGFLERKRQASCDVLVLPGRKEDFRSYEIELRRVRNWRQVVGDRLIGCMAREMRIPKADFLQFVECGMSGDDYKTRMISDGQVQR